MAQRPDTQQIRRTRIIGSILVFVLIGLRLIHLGADPPASLWTESFGPFVDEGYKTLDARNLALFGETHWNEQDDYPGWLPRSPITQLSFLASFQVLGQEIESARLITSIWFLLILLIFLWVASSSYQPSIVYLGLILMGVNLTLFAFSRLAIFEIPITFFLLLALLTLRQLSEDRPLVSLALIMTCLNVGAFGIKASTVLYFVPVIAAVGLVLLIHLPSRVYRFTILAGSAVLLGGLLAFFFDFWAPRLDLDIARITKEFLAGPISWAHPLMATAAFLVIGQSLYDDWRGFLETPYRASLLALCIGGPFLLSLFSYNPLRYCVPLLPVYILLVLEWLHFGSLEPRPRSGGRVLGGVTSAGALFLALVALLLASNRLVLGWVIPEQHALPPYVAPLRFTQIFLIALAATFAIALTPARKAIFSRSVTTAILIFILAVGLIVDATAIYLAIAEPERERVRISEELEALLPTGASLGGEWAPIFAIGTDLKSLYMNKTFNAPPRARLVRPDYLLVSDTLGMRDYRRSLEADPSVTVSPPIYESEYKSRRLFLHPLSYRAGTETDH